MSYQRGISASFVRELYALATFLQRATSLKSENCLEKVELPFTKLYCGLIGEEGNGVIIMQYLKGESLYDLMKMHDDT